MVVEGKQSGKRYALASKLGSNQLDVVKAGLNLRSANT